MNTSDASTIAMEFSGIIVFEDNVADVGIVSILDLLRHGITVNSENVLRVTDLNDGVRIELALKGVRIVLLIDPLDPKESLFNVIDIILALFGIGHLEVVNSLLQGVHLCMCSRIK